MAEDLRVMAEPGTVLLAGATGLVGGLAVPHLLAPGAFARVVVLARRPLPRREAVEVRVVDFAHLHREPLVEAEAAVCALGTTIARAGSREAFRAVDVDGVLAFARWARETGVSTFVLVSSVGADPAASSFYLRCKGEAEERVAAMGFDRFVALRPSLLLGRRGEKRSGEAIAQRIAPLASPLLVGPLRRYRAVDADVVAAAAARAALDRTAGRFVWEHDELRA
jgi:uncharacterized protein YbjT (DUF2867 family)